MGKPHRPILVSIAAPFTVHHPRALIGFCCPIGPGAIVVSFAGKVITACEMYNTVRYGCVAMQPWCKGQQVCYSIMREL